MACKLKMHTNTIAYQYTIHTRKWSDALTCCCVTLARSCRKAAVLAHSSASRALSRSPAASRCAASCEALSALLAEAACAVMASCKIESQAFNKQSHHTHREHRGCELLASHDDL